jgi:AraC family transcriptional activator of pobA
MLKTNKINLYDRKAFTSKFMPSEELDTLVKDESGKFFITRIEEMYRLVSQNVPASRSMIHSVLYLTEGEAVMKIGSEQYKIHRDEMLFVPAGQVFSFQTGDLNKGYICGIHPDMLTGKFGFTDIVKEFEFLGVWGNPMVKLNSQTSEFVLHIMKRLLLHYGLHGLKNQEIIQSYLLALFCEIKCDYKPLSASRQLGALSITNRFKELLFAEVKNKHRVAEYADLLHISPNHLNKAVRVITGKSPTRWIDEAIVSEARVLLCHTDLQISEIAVEVGIEDQSYFTRLFKKYEGLAPSAFRKMIERS